MQAVPKFLIDRVGYGSFQRSPQSIFLLSSLQTLLLRAEIGRSPTSLIHQNLLGRVNPDNSPKLLFMGHPTASHTTSIVGFHAGSAISQLINGDE